MFIFLIDMYHALLLQGESCVTHYGTVRALSLTSRIRLDGPMGKRLKVPGNMNVDYLVQLPVKIVCNGM